MTNISEHRRIFPRHVNIVIPMAGHGSRFSAAGYLAPKPLIDVFGKTMIETVIENLRPQQAARFIFVCQKDHYNEYDLGTVFQRALGDAWDCIQIDGVTEGAACTVLKAAELIDNDSDLIVANSDQLVDCDVGTYLSHARDSGVDGLLMTFPATDTKWSYISIDAEGFGIEVAEKRRISQHATVGIYYFSSGRLYIQAASRMIGKNIRVNNEFYVAPVYNEIIGNGGKVRLWGIKADAMHGIGTPEDLGIYFASCGGYRSRSAPAS